MSKKVVETSKMADGRFIYQIGETDDMGGGFGCFFEDSRSGEVKYFDETGKRIWYAHKAAKTVYEGEFFSTREGALEAGRAAL